MSTALALPSDATATTTDVDATLTAAAVRRMRTEIGALMRGARALLRTAETTLDLDLDQDAYEVLGHVVTRRRTHPADIVTSLRADRNSVRRHLIELERLGLVARRVDVLDP